MNNEINYKMTAAIDGVETHEGDAALIARVSEWLDTPQGSIWGAPHWGNRLIQYKHLPMNSDTAAAIQNSIADKLPQDMGDVAVSAVAVTAVEPDLWKIQLKLSGVAGIVDREVSL